MVAANPEKFRRIDVLAERSKVNPLQPLVAGANGGSSPAGAPTDALLGHKASRNP